MAEIDHAETKEQARGGQAARHSGTIMPYKQSMQTVIFSSISVRPRPGNRQQGWLAFGPHRILVALGRGGIKANKREGDGATPRGCYRLVQLRFRADRCMRPSTRLPIRAINPDDAWKLFNRMLAATNYKFRKH